MTKPDTEQLAYTSRWVQAQPIVMSYIFGLVRDRHDAEDLLQDIAVEAYRNFERYDPAQSFITWVMTITRHRTVDYFRRQRKQSRLFEERTLAALAAAHERLADEESSRRLALAECLKTINPRGRNAIEWKYREGLSAAEIARRLRTSAQAVSTLLYKVRLALADCITRRLKTEKAE